MDGNCRKRIFQKILCWAVLCCPLFFCGCNTTGLGNGTMAEQMTQQGKIEVETEYIVKQPETADISGQVGNSKMEECIAAVRLQEDGFWESAWRDAGIDEEDSDIEIMAKLWQCESLVLRARANKKDIFSLEGLQYFPNLKNLVIDIDSAWDDSEIEDFMPILELSKLEQLYISYDTGEQISLSFLSEMETVKELFLPNCTLKDIAFLQEMPQLERLSLYHTMVEDLAVLETLPNLVELTIAGNAGAKHIEAVGKLTHMQDLGLQECGIKDISFLRNLTELRGVNLNDNSVTDLTPLAGLTKLEQLGAVRNGISDITPLQGLSNIFNLALDGNEISDISALEGMAHLNQAGLSDNCISDFSPLAGKEELMYVSAFGNPCMDLQPIWEVPLLNCTQRGVTEKEAEQVAQWLEQECPEITEYECIDYVEGDLDNDGRMDIAFVIEGDFEESGELAPDRDRRLFVLLRQKDDSWKALEDVPDMPSGDSGGLRGDPHKGMVLGKGSLMLELGFGSSSGETDMEIYQYHNGKLGLAKRISVSDYVYAEGYDVYVSDIINSTWYRYAIAMDGAYMVRVNLADSAYPSHEAFPNISLFDSPYYIYHEKIDTNMSASKALDSFQKEMAADAEKLELPYVSWQKENYELLISIELPDYYYCVGNEYIYYNGLVVRNGQLFHKIFDGRGKNGKTYLIHDDTGEIQSD